MTRLRMGLAVLLISAMGVFAAGCGGDDEPTPAAGTTTPPPAATTAPATTAPPETTAAAGDAAAGKTFFESTCQNCHAEGGTVAGNGPVLAGKGLAEDGIRDQIENGGGGMPAGLADGADLDNVVAFVASIQ